MILPTTGNKAVLYMRLSRDEESKGESNSITNQRRILEEYAAANGFTVVGEYIDDGVSGVNFNRPAFSKMLEDANEKSFQVILAKDLSRLGRDHIGVGEHLEKIFPQMGLRFVAISEGYDTKFDEEPSADMVPIINFFNEFHAKSTSRKTKASKLAMAKAGKFQGSKAPFGYILDPEDKHHLLLDVDAVDTITKIFQLACEGYGYKAIAKQLRDGKFLNPSAYCLEKNPDHYQSEYWQQPHDWHASSIKTILHNQCYLGHLVSGKRRVQSFKTKKTVKMEEEDWVIVEDTHEPIITQKVWDLAHQKLSVRTRSDNHGAIQMFAGLVKCYDCGYALHFTQSGKHRQSPRYQCSLYNVKGKAYCRSHFITYNDLYKIVLEDVQRRARCAASLDSHVISRVQKEANSQLEKQRKTLKKDCEKLESRVEEIDHIIPKLYEDSTLGLISRERAMTMMTKFEAEQKELLQKQQEAKNTLRAFEEKFSELEIITQAVANYENIPSLNITILNELISEIRVGVKEMIDGERQQKVKIIYKQACYVEYFEHLDFSKLADLDKIEGLEAELKSHEVINY